jgi:hypothetical protein
MMSRTEINLCKLQDMSICTADSRLQQKNCNFYEKSINANRCMYYVFEEYCDCLKAQLHAGQRTHNKKKSIRDAKFRIIHT